MDDNNRQEIPDSYGTGKAPTEHSRGPLIIALLGILLGTNFLTAGFFFGFGQASKAPSSQAATAESTPSSQEILAELEDGSGGGEMAEGITAVTALAEGQSHEGTGIILSSDGYILTNAAIVEKADSLTVTLNDGRSFAAQIVGMDQASDVAVVKIGAVGLHPADYAQSDNVALGDSLTLFAFPFETEELTRILVEDSQQFIGGMDRRVLRVDCGTGGLLVDENGLLVALGTRYGDALPISEAVALAGELIFYGGLNDPSSFGMEIALLDEAQRSYWALPGGVAIIRVAEDGNAQRAGLQRGDVLLGIDGTAVSNSEDYWQALENCRDRQSVQVEIYRSGSRLTLELFLGE